GQQCLRVLAGDQLGHHLGGEEAAEHADGGGQLPAAAPVEHRQAQGQQQPQRQQAGQYGDQQALQRQQIGAEQQPQAGAEGQQAGRQQALAQQQELQAEQQGGTEQQHGPARHRLQLLAVEQVVDGGGE